MARTLKANRLSGVCYCVVVLVLFTFRIDGAQAVGNSSVVGSGSTSDGTVGNDDGNTVEKGMRPFFDMVQGFLAVVQPKRIHEESWLNLSEIVQDGKFQEDQLSDWKDWVLYLVGFVVCAAVGVLFFIVMPITGLIFCCCRCAGRCGGKPKPQDSKRARCKRNTYCTLLLVFNTVALAGVVCVFLSNQILYDKMRNENDQGPIGKLVHSADLVNGFINDTIDEVIVAVLDRFLDAKDGIIKDIEDTADQAVQDILDTMNISALLDQSKAVARDVNRTKEELLNVADQLQFLSDQGNLLSENLTALGSAIDRACTPPSLCPGIDTSKYAISANFSGLDNLSTEITNVEEAINLDDYITEAEGTIETAKKNATDTVDTGIRNATGSIDEVEESIRSAIDEITADLQGEITTEVDKFRSDVRDSQDDITKYSQYVWYAGLGIACALLLVVVLYYVGILFGLCGERPGFGAQCCNTGTGSNFLMAGVGFTFILSWLIMLVCVITFVVGGPLYTEVCRYVDDHQPQDLQPFSDPVMNLLDLKNSLFNGKDVDLSLVTILEDCKNDSALYGVFRLEHMVNLTEELDLEDVEKSLDKLKSKSFDIPEIDILTTEMNDSLTEFANSGVDSISFDDYNAQVNKNMTEEELPTLAQQLRTAATAAPSPGKENLISAADQLDQLQADVVNPMQQAKESLKTSLDYLQYKAASGIKESTEALQQGLQEAEDNFNSQKDTLVQDQVGALVDRVMGTIRGLVNSALYDVNNNIGKCRSVYDGFYTATDAACVVALEPLNGLWFSIGWCLFFFVPALIFAVKLVGLYRREHEERDFDDPNFHLYSDGGKQDSIPLTSRQQQQQPRGRGSMDSEGGDRQPRGVANGAYQADSHMGPTDYPNYNGGAVNPGYQDDVRATGPPPYGAQSYPYGPHGAMNGNPKSRNDRMYPY